MKSDQHIRNDYKTPLTTPARSGPNLHWGLRWTALTVGLAVLGVVMAKTQQPDPQAPGIAEQAAAASRHVALELPDNPRAVAPDVADASADATGISEWHTLTIRRGDTLAARLAEEGITPATVHALATAGDAGRSLGRLRPGDRIRLGFGPQGELQRLERQRTPDRRLVLRHADGGYSGQVVHVELERRLLHAYGQIDSSLFEAAADAGLSNRLTMDLVDIFRWDIDFIYSVREGDSFSVVYEAFYKNGDRVKTGNIVAAEFVNQGEVHRAVRYDLANGDADYFAPDGTSMRKAFLRTPVKFTRISSRYGRRYHPILHHVRMHTGVDFAARRGTPIHATGAGRIVFRGRNGGYGNMVVIKHAGKYSTAYGHMNHFARGEHVGTHVSQGEVIGYVGSTGLSTGPHVHYELRKYGHTLNPLKANLPSAAPVPRDQMDAFRQTASPLLAQLGALHRAYAELEQ